MGFRAVRTHPCGSGGSMTKAMMFSAVAAATAACGGGAATSGSSSTPTPTQSCGGLTATSATPSPGFSGSVFTIVMENKSRGDILGNKDAPYINALANAGAVAAGYHDPHIHPSEPNYLWMVAGESFGVLDDQDPAAHPLDS